MICKWIQWKLENELDSFGEIRSHRLNKHLSKCQSCRSFCEQLNHTADHLQLAATREISDEQVQRLQDRIGREIDEQSQTARTIILPQKQVPVLRIAAAVLLLIGLTLLIVSDVIDEKSTKPIDQQTVALLNSSNLMATSFPQLLKLPEQSLQTEAEKLVSDARQFAAFIGKCTPAGYFDPTKQPDETEMIQ